MKTKLTRLCAGLMIAALATPVLAVDHNWLINTHATPTLDGTINLVDNWDSDGDVVAGEGTDTIPGSSDLIRFNNNAATAYTANLNANIQTSWYQIATDKVTFDLSGFDLIARDATTTYNYGDGSRIAALTNEVATVTVSSSIAGTNSMRNFLNAGDAPYVALLIGTSTGANATLNINKSLGFAAKLENSGNVFIGAGYTGGIATVNIDGAGSEFNTYQAGGGQFTDISGGATVNVTNGGKFHAWFLQTAQSYGVANVNVQSGGILEAADGVYGYFDPSNLTVDTGGTWTGRDVQMGYFRFYSADSTYARMSVDGATSSVNFRNLTMGIDNGNDGNASLIIKNNSLATVSQTLRQNAKRLGASAVVDPNTITLDTGTLRMGSVGTAGLLQIGGVLRGSGTIDKPVGAPNFAISVGILNNAGTPGDLSDDNTAGEVRPGDLTSTPAIGTLAVADGNLNETSGGTTYFNVATGGVSDLIAIIDGTATLNGALNYSPVGVWTPTWQTTYTFLTADAIAFAPTSDNMAALMSSYGYAPGVYFYGVNDIGGGQEALQLIIPEPTSLGLLAVGVSGLLLRRRRRNQN